MSDVSIAELVIAVRAPPAASARAMSLERRLRQVVASHLPDALAASLGVADIVVGEIDVPLDFDPSAYDDVTLARMWASRIAARVRAAAAAAGAPPAGGGPPEAGGAGGLAFEERVRRLLEAMLGHPVGPAQAAAAGARLTPGDARAVMAPRPTELRAAEPVIPDAVRVAILEAWQAATHDDAGAQAGWAATPAEAPGASAATPATSGADPPGPAPPPTGAPDPEIAATQPPLAAGAPEAAARPAAAGRRGPHREHRGRGSSPRHPRHSGAGAARAAASGADRPGETPEAPEGDPAAAGPGPVPSWAGAPERGAAPAPTAPALRDGTGWWSLVGGLCLLWPWLAAACDRVTAGREPPDAWRRVLLWQLGAPGEPWAADDPLVRLLAGQDPGESPAPLPAELADADLRDDAEAVLESFAAALPGFERSTVGYLRANFVWRGAVVERLPDGSISARLEPLPLDPVLDRLPYPIGAFRLPWTPELAVSVRSAA